MITVFIRTIILYAVVVFVVRLMGKRQIGQLAPTELVITILISNIATLPLEDQDVPLMLGILPIVLLGCLDVFMSWGTMKSKMLRKIVSGNPITVIRNGNPDKMAMYELRLSTDDLIAAVHSKDVQTIEEVETAIVETNGNVSVFPKSKKGG